MLTGLRDRPKLFEADPANRAFCACSRVNGRESSQGEKAGSQDGDRCQVRPDKRQRQSRHPVLGDRRTVVKDRTKPLKTGTLRDMCKQLGIDPNDL